MNKKTTIKIIKIIVSILLLVIIFRIINWTEFIKNISGANFFYILISALLFFSGVLWSVFRWSSILFFLKIKISKKKLFGLYLAGSFLNNFLPTSIGGDAYKYINLSKIYPNNKKNVLSSMILERGTGFLTFFIFNIFTLYFFKEIIFKNTPLRVIETILLSLFVAILLLFVFHKKIILFFNSYIIKHLPFSVFFKKVLCFIQDILSINKLTIIKSLFFSSLFIINIVAGQLLLLEAFNIHVGSIFFDVIFVISIIQLSGILPISINSIGVTEGLTVFLYGLIGVSPEISLAIALIGRVSMILCSTTGAIPLIREGSPQKVIPVPCE